MRKFRFVGDNSFYTTDFVLNQVYGGDVQKDSWRCVEDLAEICPEYWEEVFEEDKLSLQDRVNGLEMSYVGADTFEVLEERVKVLEGLIKKPYEESEQTVFYKFVGDIDGYHWNVNPVQGHTYTLDQIKSMFGNGFSSPDVNLIDKEWEIVSDEIAKPEQKLLPQKYQLIEVRDYDTDSWCRRLFCGFGDLRGIQIVKTLYGCDLKRFVNGDFTLKDTDNSFWRQWRFID